MWRDGTQVTPLDINVVLERGGLGDNVARLPAIKWILENANHTTMHLWVPDYFLEVAEHALAPYNPRVVLNGFSKIHEELNEDYPALSTSARSHTTLKTHLTLHAFHTLADYSPQIEECSYLKIRPEDISISPKVRCRIPATYAVVTIGYTAKARQWRPKYINEVTRWMNSAGITPVFLGKGEAPLGAGSSIKATFGEGIDYTQGVDLRDQTTLLQAAKIMGKAKFVVGLDNGLLHLAAMTDVPIVAGYTTLQPHQRLPYRNGNLGWNCSVVYPSPELKCRGCQGRTSLIFGHDYRTCFYKDYLCTSMLRGEYWITAIKKILGGDKKENKMGTLRKQIAGNKVAKKKLPEPKKPATPSKPAPKK